MGLEVQAQVEERRRHRPLGAEQKGDQQPARSTIPIKERMDGFELNVCKRGLDQCRDADWIVVEELFEQPETAEGPDS
jgi:hypothetical protein